MSAAITVADIRKGDVVRIEYRDVDALLAGVVSHEFKAGHDFDRGPIKFTGAVVDRPYSYYLLAPDTYKPRHAWPTECGGERCATHAIAHTPRHRAR